LVSSGRAEMPGLFLRPLWTLRISRSRLQADSTTYQYLLAGDPAGIFRCEEQSGIGNVVHRAHSAERSATDRMVDECAVLSHHGAYALGIGSARGESIDANFARTELLR